MHILTVDASKAQGRKLARGQAVRIKQGTGFNLIVHPTTYRLATRAFNKGKAVQVKLSPEELEANKAVQGKPEMMEDHEELHGEMVGTGFFDFITKPLSKAYKSVKGGVQKLVKNPDVMKVLKSAGKYGLGKLTDVAATAASAAPIPIPGANMLLSKGVRNLGKLGEKAIDDPSSIGGVKGAAKTLLTGKGMGYGMPRGCGLSGIAALRAANKGTADANAGNSHYTNEGIKSRRTITPSWHDNPFAPRSRGMGVAIVGHGGGMIGMHQGWFPPALVSQPYSANYQMSHFLPVPYQHFNRSMEVDDAGSESDEEYHGRGFGRHRGRGFGLYA
jgi:hypothetical protein